MRSLTLALGTRGYPILIGGDLLERADLVQPLPEQSTDSTRQRYDGGPALPRACAQRPGRVGAAVTPIILPDGEAHETWESLNLIHDALLAARCDRATTIVALGGGVVGDLAGLPPPPTSAAYPSSRYQPPCRRWIHRWAARPASTLAQQDVVAPSGSRKLVLADADALKTLPARELSAGFGGGSSSL